MPGFDFILDIVVINVLRPSSIAKHHDNYSIVPNLYTYVRSVPCINTIYGGEEGKRKWGTRSAAPTMSTPKPSDMTSGDSIGGFAVSRPCLFPLVRREGNGEDGGARMSCTYPIDLKPRTLSNVHKYESLTEKELNILVSFKIPASFIFHACWHTIERKGNFRRIGRLIKHSR